MHTSKESVKENMLCVRQEFSVDHRNSYHSSYTVIHILFEMGIMVPIHSKTLRLYKIKIRFSQQ